MNQAVAAEFVKMFTTRIWWVLAVVLFVYIGLLAGGLAALFSGIQTGAISPDVAGTGVGGVPTAMELPPLIYSFASSVGYVFPVLLGALATTGEFRHQTLTPTFLATPRRSRVLSAKVLVMFVVGAGFGVVALAASVGIGSVVMNGFGVDPNLTDGATLELIGRSLLAMGLWAVLGVGLGVLVPSQVASIVIVLAFTQFVEPLLRFAAAFLDWTARLGNYLPGAASDALVGASIFTVASPAGIAPLDWWQGGLVLLGYAVLATLGGYLVSWRRDVT